MGELSNTTINGVSYDFKDAGAARQSHSHTKSQITDFPTSMPASDVSAWAKASSKPSYTASEVGAVPNTAAGVSAAINQLTTGDSAPTDNDYYVSQYAGGGTSTTTYHRRPVSKLWDYIKSKLSSKGSATQPVYFSNGVPVATTYTLSKSVPADAKFTDTTYSAATTSAAGLMSAADKTKLDGIASGAQVNSITGVKGNAESNYRTGNVNLTPANIGAAAASDVAVSYISPGDFFIPYSGGSILSETPLFKQGKHIFGFMKVKVMSNIPLVGTVKLLRRPATYDVLGMLYLQNANDVPQPIPCTISTDGSITASTQLISGAFVYIYVDYLTA